jgi:MFS family permease
MTNKHLSNKAILKALFWMWLFCFLLLLLVIGLVYASNVYFSKSLSFEAILFYVLFSLLLLIFPLISKIRISNMISKKILFAAVLDKPDLTKEEWRLFFVWHGLLIAFLFVTFVFCRPYLFTLQNFFGDGRKNPAVLVFIMVVLGLQYAVCLVHNKMTTGDWYDEKHPKQILGRRFDIAASIMLASTVIMFISWVAMMMITRRLSL